MKMLGNIISKRARNLLRPVIRKLSKLNSDYASKFLQFNLRVFPQIYSYLTFSNESETKKDGTGAQIQRMLAVASVAEMLERPYVQSPIRDVAVHPLDPFQDPHEYRNFISKLNDAFELDIPDSPTTVKVIKRISRLTIRNLHFAAVQSYCTKKYTLLKVVDPYPISDLCVKNYLKVVPRTNMYKRLTQSQKNFPYVAIHYRQGVGNFAIYPGQSISREIDLQYFKNILQQYFAEKSELKQVVHIFTDSPNSIIYYNPPQDQLYLWEGSPGFKDGTLEIKPLIFTAELLGVDEVVVHSGGDPLEAIEKMAQATLLVTGRSSLSYVAGLMNASGSVYAAPAFWHPKLPQWREGIFNV